MKCLSHDCPTSPEDTLTASWLRLAYAASPPAFRGVKRRHIAIYLVHIAWSAALSGLGRLTGLDRATLRYACRRVENIRDHMQSDRALSALEAALVHVAAVFCTIGSAGR